MKTKIYNWLLKKVEPKFTPEQKKKINEFKMIFRIHFEGYDQIDIPTEYIPISKFGITDLKFKFDKNNFLTVEIVLLRPGILIGKGGRTINTLSNYLSKHDMKITITESKLWNRLK